MKSIGKEWDSFVLVVLPATAPPIQKQEMRRAFYAGAEAALRIQWEIGGPDVTEAEGVAALERFHDELKQFAADVAEGRK